MPKAACHSCGSALFEVLERELPGAAHGFVFVQCATCGSPVAALEAPSLGARLDVLAERLAALAAALDVQLTKINGRIDELAAALGRSG